MAEKTKRIFDFGHFRLDSAEGVLLADGHPVPLTPKAYETLVALLENSGHILEKDALLKRIWPDTFVEEGTLVQNISTLRKILGEAEEGSAYIETIPRRGYRFVGTVREADFRSGPEEKIVPVPGGRVSRTGIRSSRLSALALAAAFLLIVFLVREWIWPATGPAQNKAMLAVLPFQNLTGDSQQEYFSNGLTEEMITQLGDLEPNRLGVIARTSAMQYKDTKKSVREVGRELGVDYILEGSVRREGDRVRITAQLIQVKDQTHLWASDYDRNLRDILVLQSDVAGAVAREIKLRLSSNERARLASRPSIDPEAYQLYLKGRYFWNKRSRDGFAEAIGYFQQAIAREPNYAQAYAGLADSYILQGPNDILPAKQVYPQAREAASKALAIDDSMAEPHASLGFVKLLYDWNPAQAELEFRRAIELDSNYPTGHHWYAYDLAAMGRMDEALREIRRAQELDPLSLIINADVAQILFFARRYDEAIAQCQRTIDLDSHFGQAYWYEGLIYEQQGMFDRAIDAFLKQINQQPTDPAKLATIRSAYRLSGMKGFWRNRLQLLERQSKEHYVSPYTFAVIYSRMGDKEKALEALRKGYDERYPSMVFLEFEPVFDGIRSDPRYAELLRLILSPGHGLAP
ncbi:MAG TPA: winged helix-turn-helix domain-containing protein [Candidatus Sulfotelmatobacter sp.]|jgi:TolB-like protein/DNA-binding winged helix-turn-helix (wHTH) protein/Tfp pilus assembly protein PilF|nr:winged helix-turn-helix domain-containing protein [Candidatus Sulfotelmatobacter sp.]